MIRLLLLLLLGGCAAHPCDPVLQAIKPALGVHDSCR
jgi:hypothetical protein